MFENPTFYPTPPLLATRMLCKIKGHPVKILEPSAGKGDLIEALETKFKYGHHQPDVAERPGTRRGRLV